MSTRLFVSNVPECLSENDLKNAFSEFGQVINVDLKSKTGVENNHKKFAFVSLSASNYEVESCIKHFSSQDLGGSRLYVTRARESFLERLQRERQESQKKDEKDHSQELPKKNPIIKLDEKLNPRKRKIDNSNDSNNSYNHIKLKKSHQDNNVLVHDNHSQKDYRNNTIPVKDKKQQDSDKKRMESILKKRQEFKEKQKIIKTGLVGIDKVRNKKVIFSDNEEDDKQPTPQFGHPTKAFKENGKKNELFDDDESDNEVNFEIKKQFEGKKGMKVLDLQSSYKSDKRFILDEKFMDDGHSEEEDERTTDQVELGDTDEKTKQLNILQDVLGIAINTKNPKVDNKKTRTKMGMLRFNPLQPDHAKFLAPVEETKQEPKKTKKKQKDKQEEPQIEDTKEQPKVEVSKEQFYKVSDTLKEALEQPATFSLRSLFGQQNHDEIDSAQQPSEYISLEKPKEQKHKNPLDPTLKNPFVYDSSDSENEEADEVKVEIKDLENKNEPKAVWKENLFFSNLDNRLKEGLEFFSKTNEKEVQKERRELKSVMKKRIYNKERKSQMFQKKIGGRKKTVKKSYKKKS